MSILQSCKGMSFKYKLVKGFMTRTAIVALGALILTALILLAILLIQNNKIGHPNIDSENNYWKARYEL